MIFCNKSHGPILEISHGTANTIRCGEAGPTSRHIAPKLSPLAVFFRCSLSLTVDDLVLDIYLGKSDSVISNDRLCTAAKHCTAPGGPL